MGISLYNGNKEDISINVFYGNALALPTLEKADEPNSVTKNVSGFLTVRQVIAIADKLNTKRYSHYCGVIDKKEWCRYWYIID